MSTPSALNRIQKELQKLVKDPIPGITAGPSGSDLFNWDATINGPEGSPYEGGVFKFKITFPSGYPFAPPSVKCTTKVYHCNFSESGYICLDILKGQFSPALGIGKVLLSISSLLTECNPNDPLVPNIAQQYKSNRKKHDETAREWTKKFASA